ncbi:hypothetical protein [Mycolicibacterium agri]|uniref:hypothetical protein n=1 Tax=Mycolicibacterium agri TaxID=36811 RepID=UPI001055C308|nr:hypothetical protein [Mycolicibacterium agri]
MRLRRLRPVPASTSTTPAATSWPPTPTLCDPDDPVVDPDFVLTCEVAFTARTGPVLQSGAGHVQQWERADRFNPLVTAYFGAVEVRRAR